MPLGYKLFLFVYGVWFCALLIKHIGENIKSMLNCSDYFTNQQLMLIAMPNVPNS